MNKIITLINVSDYLSCGDVEVAGHFVERERTVDAAGVMRRVRRLPPKYQE